MEKVDYERVIEDLQARRAAYNASVDAAINALRAVVSAGHGVTTQSESPHFPEPNGGNLTPDKLFSKSIPEAVMICLRLMKKPMTTKEVVEALEGASYHHQSQNFGNTVNSIMHRRAATTGDVVKIGRTWALSEWYPGRRKTQKGPIDLIDGDPDQDGGNAA